jgi:methylthioribulose-1-phosphate dehydratase
VAATRELVCEMLRLFYGKGWASGTGGGICAIEAPGRLLVAPTGVHKERVRPEDLFVIDPASGNVIEPAADDSLRPSECAGVFRGVIALRGAGSVVHSHGLEAVLAGDLAREYLVIAGLEMLKGVRGLTNTDELAVPVVANTPRESDIVASVLDVLRDDRFQQTFAVIVRDHGAYVWGEDVWEAKRHAECYHYLFEAIRRRSDSRAENRFRGGNGGAEPPHS